MRIRDLPNELTQQNVLTAIAKFNEGVEHSFGPSTTYDLLYDGQRYPPKAIAGMAWSEILNEEVTTDTFDGGAKSKCFRVLRRAGFRVVPKTNPFMVGHKYERKTLPQFLGIDEDTTKGDWATGYHFHRDVEAEIGWWFLFPNVGESGRTGHDYSNSWVSSDLLQWQSKNNAKLGHSQIQSMLSGESPVLLFAREDNRSPFTYHGLVSPESVEDGSPVNVVWRVTSDPQMQIYPQPVSVEAEFESRAEGKPSLRYVTTYERNPKNRNDAIRLHGTACVVCGFDFFRAYGELGDGFIHIHHKSPVSESGIVEVNPETDLAPVCPNCHAMIHRKQASTLTIDELRELACFRVEYEETE